MGHKNGNTWPHPLIRKKACYLWVIAQVVLEHLKSLVAPAKANYMLRTCTVPEWILWALTSKNYALQPSFQHLKWPLLGHKNGNTWPHPLIRKKACYLWAIAQVVLEHLKSLVAPAKANHILGTCTVPEWILWALTSKNYALQPKFSTPEVTTFGAQEWKHMAAPTHSEEGLLSLSNRPSCPRTPEKPGRSSQGQPHPRNMPPRFEVPKSAGRSSKHSSIWPLIWGSPSWLWASEGLNLNLLKHTLSCM